jgi:hypothetical protein
MNDETAAPFEFQMEIFSPNPAIFSITFDNVKNFTNFSCEPGGGLLNSALNFVIGWTILIITSVDLRHQ